MIKNIPFSEIETIPKIIKDFLADNLSGATLYNFNLGNIKKAIERKSTSYSDTQRETLYQTIKKQYEGYNLEKIQQENLDALRAPCTFTITTGHQLNLFTGPVFFIYKILQTIKTCTYLKEHFPEYNFVPIFWMATEDHDFEEINHFRTEKDFYELQEEHGGAVGRIRVEPPDFIAQFKKDIEGTPYAEVLTQWIQQAYRVENTLAQAIRLLAQKLFSHYGLLLLDGDDKGLKAQMIPYFKEELLHHSLKSITRTQISILSECYGKVQVNPREINLFYLSKTRNRIEKRAEGYQVVDTTIQFSESELIAELETHPERFSPNALLRPVYQEAILPNIAYIGGNAEIAYWLELVDYFQEHHLPFPILVPRNSLLFVSDKILNKIEKSALSLEDFFGDFQKTYEAQLLAKSPLLPLIEQKETLLVQAFEDLKQEASLTEPTFLNLVEAEQVRQLKSYQKMKKRLLKAERIKHTEQIDYLKRLNEALSPNKQWQERQYNFSVFYKNFGIEWIDYCHRAIEVDKSSLIICSI